MIRPSISQMTGSQRFGEWKERQRRRDGYLVGHERLRVKLLERYRATFLEDLLRGEKQEDVCTGVRALHMQSRVRCQGVRRGHEIKHLAEAVRARKLLGNAHRVAI